MSLISSSHFIAPFRSKVQVVLVLVVAFLVAVVRMSSSGTLSTEPRDSGRGAGASSAAVAGGNRGDPDVDAYLASKTRGRLRGGSGDVTVDTLLDRRSADTDSEDSLDREAEEAAREPGNLNDIKRSLGME